MVYISELLVFSDWLPVCLSVYRETDLLGVC